jgi:hypothetical protein
LALFWWFLGSFQGLYCTAGIVLAFKVTVWTNVATDHDRTHGVVLLAYVGDSVKTLLAKVVFRLVRRCRFG